MAAKPLFGLPTLDEYSRKLQNPPPPEKPIWSSPPREPSTLKATAPSFVPSGKGRRRVHRKLTKKARRNMRKTRRR